MIMLNDVLNLNSEEIKNSKIELNMNAGRDGEAFLDRWLSYSREDRENGYGRNWKCSFWGWYGKGRKNFQKGQWVFSFIRISTDTWLFVSAAEILDVPKNSHAKVKILKRFMPFFGKLVISYHKGNTFSLYVFNSNKVLPTAHVKEILPCLYSPDKFESYDKVHLPYKKLADILSGKIMPSYKTALEQISGIYCLTNTDNGKLYIGSAYGQGGVAQRWSVYLRNQTGDNKKLVKLLQEKGAAYFEKYFTFTLLEFFGKNYDKDKIIAREQYWKECFNTIQNGYNAN